MSVLPSTHLHTDADGIRRCAWCHGHTDYQLYHDEEWGRPVTNDILLFEKMCLESFQSGLSWLTILRKREHFRAAFADFDFHQLVYFGAQDVAILLQNKGIVRHRGKIEAALNNAHRALAISQEFGSFAAYIWQWEPKTSELHIGKGEHHQPIPSITQTSQAFSQDLKRRGWKFFGPTTAYAFMQSMGLVNDHIEGCICHPMIEDLRLKLNRDFMQPT